jgi:hypothetical protein
LPEVDQKYAVNCLFEPFTLPYPENVTLTLEESIGFLDTIKYPSVQNADIRLFHNGSLLGNFVYTDSANLYSLEEGVDLPHGLYNLEIEINGEQVIAQDILPEKTKLKKIIINPYAGNNEYGRSYAKVWFVFKDPVDKLNYYEIAISHSSNSGFYDLQSDFPAITAESYYPTILAVDYSYPEFIPFSDAYFNGQLVSIPVTYLHPIAPFEDKVSSHVITVHLRSISKNYYLYRTSLLKQGYSIHEDYIFGQSEPINVHGNIIHNYGIFAGYQSVDHTFIIMDNNFIEYDF